ncbi:thioredoxin domain-containing protein [uncultured Muriicola sp.]|uniref:thioredoxin domain-containing protein n=1 Tax=uncultured Muriicola sp. TaxID=1583102 RepID=UPI002612C261|nr:thioredoxin domain-containing protein [uncultured Muriicola sp.]
MSKASIFSSIRLILFSVGILFIGCKPQASKTEDHAYTNALIDETSPYLLQHAHNPVNWVPWSEKALEEAKEQDKLIVVSIGYSSCHWCHVMEEESFEDTEVASLMNDNFINIKVDREERPDVDQVYMTAVQLMTGSGGWPLNVILLPNGKPLYGGTYHTKAQWIKVLTEINKQYRKDKKAAEEYANKVAQGISEVNFIPKITTETDLKPELLTRAVNTWKKQWDMEWGGNLGKLKFIIPVNLNFLLDYAALSEDLETDVFVENTLNKVLQGGIYDHIGGGFFRYSTDTTWKVPHFEKMLYDNAQLLSLYSKAYTIYKDPEYKRVVLETIEFLDREMKNPDGGYYAAIDADSEGEEGTYYVWKENELRSLLGDEYDLFASYYSIKKAWAWEKDKYVLHKRVTDRDFEKKHGITNSELQTYTKKWQSLLLKQREQRIHPRVDDKIITSWNALLIQGFLDAYKAFGNQEFLSHANSTFDYLLKHSYVDSKLVHTYKKGSTRQEGFLEDYTFLANASLGLYEINLDTTYLELSKELTGYVKVHFGEPDSEMYRYNEQASLIAKIIKTDDGVIPSPNAVMAQNLFKLGHLYYDTDLLDRSQRMVSIMVNPIQETANNYAMWGSLLLEHAYPFYEIVGVGANAKELLNAMHTEYIPNALFAGSTEKSDLPLFEDRYVEGETYIYVCYNYTCKLPVKTVTEALQQLQDFQVY